MSATVRRRADSPPRTALAKQGAALWRDAKAGSSSSSDLQTGIMSSRSWLAETVPRRFNNDECVAQLIFGVTLQNIFQFGVNCRDGRRLDSQINYASAFSFHENQSAEIPVAGDEDATFARGNRQQFTIGSLR